MPENDVTKMKVADLKRELKLRGLATNGNKNELQDRLQTALLEGDISLDDSAIANAIDDDDVLLSDEDDHKLLDDDHDDLLLKSPVATPTDTTVQDLLLPNDINSSLATATATSSNDAAALPAKKIVLKRNNSQLLLAEPTATTPSIAKENAVPTEPATAASSKTHKPIVIGGGSESKGGAKELENKASQLTMKERLELRAKKFGITPNSAASTTTKTSTVVNKSSSASIKANKGDKETEEQQKEALKRRAERFGCVVPDKIAKPPADEKLLKRKERFGVVTSTTSATDSKTSSVYADKARARLERFKQTPAASTTD